MPNSTTHLDTIIQGQGSQDLKANALFDAIGPASLYGRRASICSGLIWGYYGGNVSKANGVMDQIANGTLTLTVSTTNYIVANKETGAVSASTATTNWNSADYWRLYSAVTGTATVTSYTDAREIGRMTGLGSGLVAPVTKTASFTLGANENEVICNGSATITATLPSAASFIGRIVQIKTRSPYTVISASSNVKPIDSDTAGTAILPAVAGRWAALCSDGTNWVITAQGSGDMAASAPVTKTGDFTLASSEAFVICNGSATITATLPSAASFIGRIVQIKTIAAYTVVSASANVVPIDSATAGTAILAATAGKWAKMVSDGTNWVVMAAN